MDVKGKNVLVTGANRGIGKAIVEALLQKGVAKVYAAARSTDSLPDFGDDRVTPLQLDITNADQVVAAAETASDTDMLINNAGVLANAGLVDGDEALLRRDMDVNVYGTLDVIRKFLPVLESREESAIVNVGSIVSFVNMPMIGGYSVSKAAQFSVSQGLRIELAPRGIRVHTVNPGPIDTDMASDLDMDKPSAEETAVNIVAALIAGEEDIFPDPMGAQMFGLWRTNYKDLEQMVSGMHHGNA